MTKLLIKERKCQRDSYAILLQHSTKCLLELSVKRFLIKGSNAIVAKALCPIQIHIG